MTIGSLFSGIGGLELGLESAGLGPVVWQCEIDPFCRSVLAKHWPNATRYEDVTQPREYQHVDVVCGGFPCQDVSGASHGLGRGLQGQHSSLWFYFAKVIDHIRPSIVVVENVASGARRWLPTVWRHLRELGYRTRAFRIDARDVGASHARARIFVVGHADAHAQPALSKHGEVAGVPEPASGVWGHWRQPKPGVVRMDDGVPRGVERLRALGNAVVPQCAYVVGLRVREIIARSAARERVA